MASRMKSQSESPMVTEGNRIWNDAVKANCMRDNNTGSRLTVPTSCE